MRLVFVHGWSVTNTDTYGGLPEALAANAPAGLELTVSHLYLARYVSFADEVSLDDLARGMQAAVQAEVLPGLARGERFACITHSTGGPLVRTWIDQYHRDRLDRCPLSHLIMLAPANHGSALAQLGKGRLSRMKFFTEGVQPGVGVLDWLELGSAQSWALNRTWLDYDPLAAGLYVFVLTGQAIDRHFYDHLNSYTGEAGSDGVVRVAAANMNYGLVRLEQQEQGFRLARQGQSATTALGVLPGRSHSGDAMGIMGSVSASDNGSHPTVRATLQCLAVASAAGYRSCAKALDALTARTQQDERVSRRKELFLFSRKFETSRYCMLVFRVMDDRGNALADYDVLFTAGPDYDANHLPPGFFVDRQRNSRTPAGLTYYLDYDVMAPWFARPQVQDKFGFEIAARPDGGYARYLSGAYRGTFSALRRYFAPNQTLMVEVVLQRRVMEGVFRLTQQLQPEDFSHQPQGEPL
ncbi:MAG TPA: hypothetical protein VMI92_11005 [Steroidobacteraceae bacterium]|nr:hypothetical protein [Steroidobacteraceae bacterium]